MSPSTVSTGHICKLCVFNNTEFCVKRKTNLMPLILLFNTHSLLNMFRPLIRPSFFSLRNYKDDARSNKHKNTEFIAQLSPHL